MALSATLALVIAIPAATKHGEQNVRDGSVASASALAAKKPPPGLECPKSDSDEAKFKAIRDQPLVVITEPPAGRLVIMRKGVVVVVKARVTSDLLVCGNDANLVLESPVANSARILMQGGTDSNSKTDGPAIYLVDGTPAPPNDNVWFTNGRPQVIPCASAKPTSKEVPLTCSSQYSTTPPSSVSTPKPAKT